MVARLSAVSAQFAQRAAQFALLREDRIEAVDGLAQVAQGQRRGAGHRLDHGQDSSAAPS